MKLRYRGSEEEFSDHILPVYEELAKMVGVYEEVKGIFDAWKRGEEVYEISDDEARGLLKLVIGISLNAPVIEDIWGEANER